MIGTQQQIGIGAGRRLGYREAGSGPAIFMAHGIGSGSASFMPQLERMSERYRLIAWDTPGYGGSDDSPHPSPTPADFAADAIALLDALGESSVHIVGHSLGGLMATALVARHPERVRKLVLSSCAAGYGGLSEADRTERLNGRREQMMRLGPHKMAEERAPNMLAASTGADTLKRATDIMARLRPEGYFGACAMLSNGNAFDEIRAWRGNAPPTLVLVGEEDRITPPPGVRQIGDCIIGSRYEEIPAAGHAAYLEQPERYCQLLEEFFAD